MSKAYTFIFILLMLLLSYYTHVFSIMQQRPQSVHMWAMCDRGSVARNYAQESMDFFHPRVHETKEGDGITGLEFPVMNYLAAICYRIFGFNEFWYRFLMFVVYCSGLLSSFLITGYFIQRTVYRYLTVFLFASTPVLTYYAASFIPDTASLGFMMTGWYFFFSYLDKPGNGKLFLVLLFTALATLVKLTSAIGVLLMIAMVIWSRFRGKSFQLTSNGRSGIMLILVGIISLALTWTWYAYARHLNETFGLSVFLMRSMRPENWEAIQSVVTRVNEIWVQFYYFKPLYYLFLLTFIYVLIRFRTADEKLRILFAGYFFGVLSFIYLMMIQFRDHDYYIITLLPLIYFLFLTAFNILEKSAHGAKVHLVLGVALSVLTIFSFNFNRKHQAFRMDEHCWLYDWARYKDYQEVEPYVKALGIKREEKAIAILDYSPNIALYFLNLKGWSVADVADDEAIRAALVHQPVYLVVNDTSQLKRPVFADTPPQKIGQYKSINFYKLNYR